MAKNAHPPAARPSPDQGIIYVRPNTVIVLNESNVLRLPCVGFFEVGIAVQAGFVKT